MALRSFVEELADVSALLAHPASAHGQHFQAHE